MNDYRWHWQNAICAVLLLLCGVWLMNYYVWHRDEFSGWSLFGFVLLLAVAAITGVLIAVALKTSKPWAMVLAFLFGLLTGSGVAVFFMKTSVMWGQALFALGACVVLGGLLTSIGLTRWIPPSSASASAAASTSTS